ncbi:MAG TPA: ATP-binding protein, partial [Luteitalea sp.]|nr:ATP-binding protein [Luteitalea sp.]
PLIVDKQVIGVIGLSFETSHRFDDGERAFMEAMVRQCSHAIEREQQYRALRTSEAQYRAFITATSDVVYRMSADWRELRQLQGREFLPDTVDPSRSWLERYVPIEDRPRVMAAVDDAIARGALFELEHRVMRTDGTIGWTYSRAIPLRDHEGRIIEWLGTARDITARVAAVSDLAQLTQTSEQQRRLYETILGTTPDLVYVFDLEHRFSYANRALLAMWGRTWAESAGRTCLELGYPDWHAAMHDREIEEVIATRRPIRGEVPFDGTNGRRMYDYIFMPVFGEDGEVEAIAGTTRDVTERTAAEATLRDREQRLAEANRVKDEFLATLSHELRTPLNAVLGWAHMLRTGPLPRQVEERALAAIERNARAQVRLVEELLDVSRIMTGKLVVRSDVVDLRRVVADAADAVRPAAKAKRLALLVTVPDVPVAVVGDAQRLQQIVWNLLSNAVKFTPDQGRIDAELTFATGLAVVEVRDTGEGIPAAFLPRVFERFQQADSAPTRRHGGLGLGLALVRHLTEAHGGTVDVASAGEGHGAVFHVRIPLASSSLS